MERRHLLANLLMAPALVSAAGPVKASPLRRELIRRKPRGVVDDGQLRASGSFSNSSGVPCFHPCHWGISV